MRVAFATWPCSPTGDWSRPARTAPCRSGIRSGKPVGDLVRLKKTVRQGSDLVRVEINVNDGTIPAGGTTIAFATSDGIVLWDADKQAVQRKIGTGPMYSVAWSLPLHRLIAAQDDRLAIYDVPTGELLASQVIWWGPGKHLFLSPEGHVRCSPGNERGCGLCRPDRRRPASHPSPRRVCGHLWMEERPGENTAIFRCGGTTSGCFDRAKCRSSRQTDRVCA